jgi:hypothetical protein
VGGLRLAVILALLIAAPVLFAQYSTPKVIARVEVPGLKESSGVAASLNHPGVFWSHNDSGDRARLYAFDRSGQSLGRFSVQGATARDWEAISMGPDSHLYIGDIGDNRSSRKFVTVYRVREPDPGSKKQITAPAQAFRFTYPDRPHDAEALMVHPRTGDLYIVSKARGEDSKTLVFKASAPLKSGKLRLIAELDLPNTSVFTLLLGRVTGGDISPDGTRAVVCDYFKAWEAELPRGAKTFDAIWKAEWKEVAVGQRAQGEGICYRHDGKALLTTSEGSPFPLIEVVRE